MIDASLSAIDVTIVAVYFVGMVALGLYLSRRSDGAEDYFLAGRGMTWPFIGLSLFASNISSSTLVGLSGDAFATGISVYAYEWMAAVVLVVFAVFFLPIVLRSQVFTMPEFLGLRYDDRVRTYFSVLTIFLSVTVETAVSLYAGAVVLQLILPETPLWHIMSALALLAGFYTITGGLAAVMITDAVQAILLLIGSSVIAYAAISQIGGLGALFEQVPDERLSLIRPLDDEGVPWLGLVTGVPLLGFYYWATNQAIVQRALAAKSVEHGRWGVLFAGALKLAPLFIMVLPGSAAILLYPELTEANLVFPTLMFDLLPTGLLGLVLAGFIAAIMSQIDSALNSASTLVTMDFVRRAKPDLSSRQLMTTGRLVMALFLVFAILWAPLISNFRSVFDYLQTIFSYAVPPVVALFLLGMFWERANARGGMAAVLVGLGLGVLAFYVIELRGLVALHFLYMAPLLFLASSAALVIGSLGAPAPAPDAIRPLMWRPSAMRDETARLEAVPPWTDYRYLAVLLLIAVASVVVWFR